MMGTTHLMTGFLLGLFSVKLLGVQNPYLMILIATIAAALPDADFITEFIYRKLKRPKLLRHFEHRRFTHSIYALIIITILSLLSFGTTAAIITFIAYSTHLFLDSLFSHGVPLFYPKRVTIASMKMHSMMEWTYYYMLITISCLLMINF